MVLLLAASGCSRPPQQAAIRESTPATAKAPDASPGPMVEVHVQIRVRGQFADDQELAVRNALEDLLTSKGLGEVVDAGSGMGVMDLALETGQPDESQRVVREFLREQGLLERATVKVVAIARPVGQK